MSIKAELTKENLDDIIEIRHTLHKNPEPSTKEFNTTKLIKEKLVAAGIEILNAPIKTGVVAIVRGKMPGKTVAIRGDIDALPIAEDPSHELCSCVDGMMHACGHDFHTAGLLGAAYILKNAQDKLCGNVVLIFQHAEENAVGAVEIINSGVLQKENISAFFALHIEPMLPEGKLSLVDGVDDLANSRFVIKVSGKSGHASAPQLSHNPINAGADIITALRGIGAWNTNPFEPFVLSVCAVSGGDTYNVIPDQMEIEGTFRFGDESMRKAIENRIEEISRNTAALSGCTATVSFDNIIIAVVNDKSLRPVFEKAAKEILGGENVVTGMPKSSSEDFAYYRKIAPIYLAHIGCNTPEATMNLHNSSLLVNDKVAEHISLILANTAIKALEL